MVEVGGIEPNRRLAYQASILPLNYTSMESAERIELSSPVWKTGIMFHYTIPTKKYWSLHSDLNRRLCFTRAALYLFNYRGLWSERQDSNLRTSFDGIPDPKSGGTTAALLSDGGSLGI